jgi:toxin ParE1/3/4
VKPVIFHAEAEQEFRAAVVYYETQRPGLGYEFRTAVEEAVERIQRFPQAFSPYGDQGARKCVLGRFPYTIFYVELEERIWIAAVAHQRRRPGYWVGRTPNASETP